jgi:phenylacetic acid degradation operon negative regulatory protein
MVERGELTAEAGVYELAGAVRRRQSAQDWALTARLDAWNGGWLLGVVTSEARTAPERAALRSAATAARLAEVREGLWTRPDNLPRAATGGGAWDVLDEQCSWWRGRPEDDLPALLAQLFAPQAWAERAEQLVGRLEPICAALRDDRHDVLAEGFVTGAAALQHVRRDPLLPAELLPGSWPGERLRTAYETYRVTYGPVVAAWFAAQG